jgi:hypothetical protein
MTAGNLYHVYYGFFLIALALIWAVMTAGRLYRKKPVAQLIRQNLIVLTVVILQILLVAALFPVYRSHVLYLMEYTFSEPFNFGTLLQIFMNFFTTKNSYDLNPLVHYSIRGGIFFLLIAAGIFLSRNFKLSRMKNSFLVTLFFLYAGIVLFFHLIFNIQVLHYKYLIILYPLIIIPAAAAVTKIRFRYFTAVFLILFVIASLFSIGPVYFTRLNGSLDKLSNYMLRNSDLETYSYGRILVTDKKTYLLLKNYYRQDRVYYLQSGERITRPFVHPESEKIIDADSSSWMAEKDRFIVVITPDDQPVINHLLKRYGLEKDPSKPDTSFIEKMSFFRHKVIFLKKAGY